MLAYDDNKIKKMGGRKKNAKKQIFLLPLIIIINNFQYINYSINIIIVLFIKIPTIIKNKNKLKIVLMSANLYRSELLKKTLTNIKNNLELLVSDDDFILLFDNISPVKITF